MIQIQLSEDEFRYDVYTLTKAFFTKEDVRVQIGIDGKQQEEKVLIIVKYEKTQVILTIKEKETIVAEGSAEFANIERKEKKNRLKRLLYTKLAEYTGKELPWGNLTGIRPVKIVMSMLEKGNGREETIEDLKKIYCISQEKAELSVEIAHRELSVLNTFDYKSGYSLYIGIPFCPTTCLYCSFTSYPITLWQKRTREYLEALYKELTYISQAMGHKRLDYIYIGGGTPTTLSHEELRSLILFIREKFDCSAVKEFCVEAGRPDSITGEKLKALKECGIERISINPQTMNEETLKVIGRQHSVKDIIQAYDLAKEAGFKTINMDIILGLPGENMTHLEHTMEEIQKLNPENLTVHSLALKRAARLNIQKQSYIEDINTAPEDMMKRTAEYAKRMGLEPYYLYRQKNMGGNLENVGYAKPGHIGLYNILIMEEKQTIIAAGAGAISKYVFPDESITRVENVKDVTNYMKRIEEMIARKEEVRSSYESEV